MSYTAKEILARFKERDEHAVESFREAFFGGAPIEARLRFTEERLADTVSVLVFVLAELVKREETEPPSQRTTE